MRLIERTGIDAADVRLVHAAGCRPSDGAAALFDLIGLDVAAAIGESLFADTAEDQYRARGLIEELISNRRLSRESQAGFYDVSEATAAVRLRLPAMSQITSASEIPWRRTASVISFQGS